jgi:hypothetical protein
MNLEKMYIKKLMLAVSPTSQLSYVPTAQNAMGEERVDPPSFPEPSSRMALHLPSLST